LKSSLPSGTERAEYIRVITAELTRLPESHLPHRISPQDMGALGTPLMYAFRERERILDLFESTQRRAHDVQLHAFRWLPCRPFPQAGLKRLALRRPKTILVSPRRSSNACSNENEIPRCANSGCRRFEARILAVSAGVTGPMLRATGVNYDLRKVDKYGIYDRFDFRVPLGSMATFSIANMIRVLKCANR
jgi:NADH-quinone oxidoreductase subunit D